MIDNQHANRGVAVPRSTPRQQTRWDTQDLAWESAKDRSQTVAMMLLDSIAACPSTCEELERKHGLSHQTCSAAVNWLMRRNLIATRATRPTRSKRKARVWHKFQPGDTPVRTRRNLRQELLETRLELAAARAAIKRLNAEREELLRQGGHR